MTGDPAGPATRVEVRGNATAEEVAAVLSVLARRASAAPVTPPPTWQDVRLAALRRTPRW